MADLIDCNPVNVSKPGERTRFLSGQSGWSLIRTLQHGAHTLTAEVLEFIYMGDIFRTRLRVAGNDEFMYQNAKRT